MLKRIAAWFRWTFGGSQEWRRQIDCLYRHAAEIEALKRKFVEFETNFRSTLAVDRRCNDESLVDLQKQLDQLRSLLVHRDPPKPPLHVVRGHELRAALTNEEEQFLQEGVNAGR